MTPESARLFVALELPSVARNTLAHWGSIYLDGVPRARNLEAQSLHVTLCFLGSRAVDEIPAIARACHVAAASSRVVLTLGCARWLPERRPRVLAVELGDGDGGLRRLQNALSRALAQGGWYQPEQRPFLAHVTVARMPKDAPSEKIQLANPTPLRFVSDAVTLYRSHTDPGGARYQPLESVGLSG